MTFCQSAFSNRFLESGRLLYGPRRDLRDAASDDVSEDSELELEDGKNGESRNSPESEDEEEVVPVDELDSFATDMLAFSTEDVERANLVSLRILRIFLRSLRSRSRRSVAWTTGSRRKEDELPPLGSTLTLVLLFVSRRDSDARASDWMSSWRIASTFASRLSFASANERLEACWAVRRRRSVSTSALRLSASSGWTGAAAFNAGDPEREPPSVLASRIFVRTPPGGT